MNKINILIVFLILNNVNVLFGGEICNGLAEKVKTKEESKKELARKKDKLQKLAAQRKDLRKEILKQESIKEEVPEELNVQLWELINEINDVKGDIFRLNQIVNRGF